MRIAKTRLASAVGAALLAACFTSAAQAGCSPFESLPAPGQQSPQSTKPVPDAPGVNGYKGAQLIQAAAKTSFQRVDSDWHYDDPLIIGLWHIQFTLDDGTVIDDGFAKNHDLTVGDPIAILTPTGETINVIVKGVFKPPPGGSPFGPVTISPAKSFVVADASV
jgi:hypothetical protein